MDPKDRETIRNNKAKLVLVTKWNEDLQNFILSHGQLKKILDNTGSSDEVALKEKFYDDIQRKGPTAYNLLTEALIKSQNLEALEIIDPQLAQSKTNEKENKKVWNQPLYKKLSSASILESTHEVPESSNHAHLPIEIKVKRVTKSLGQPVRNFYPMSSKPRGHALIIDNEDFENEIFKKRFGSHVDSNNLKILYTELGFEVTLYRNLNHEMMYKSITSFSQRTDHGDMTIVVVLSHGDKGKVFSTDGRSTETQWILKQFNNAYCPQLCGKPKFFIFQACRGDEPDFGFTRQAGSTATDAVGFRPEVKDPSWEDMLIAYATIPGYVANRDRYKGTWFIESVCDIFMNYACEMDIRDMLDLVGQKMRSYESEFGTKQSCSYEVIHFFKKLYFNPGIYEDNSNEESLSRSPNNLVCEIIQS